MTDNIIVMADNIGQMADRIVETQNIQHDIGRRMKRRAATGA
jgi:hypothetical protein